MALNDYQVSYGGVTLGPGTEYRINTLDGIRSMPSIRNSDVPRLKFPGVYTGVDVLDARVITVTVTVMAVSDADLDAKLSALEAATVPLVTGTSPLSFKLPNQTTKRVDARPRKRSFVIEPTYRKFWGKTALEFFCGDPTIYSDGTNSAAVGTITNAGNVPTKPTITVTGATTITNATDGGGTIVIAASTVGAVPNPTVINVATRTVVDGGGANRFDVIAPATTWFSLLPGANVLSGSGTVVWRDGYA